MMNPPLDTLPRPIPIDQLEVHGTIPDFHVGVTVISDSHHSEDLVDMPDQANVLGLDSHPSCARTTGLTPLQLRLVNRWRAHRMRHV